MKSLRHWLPFKREENKAPTVSAELPSAMHPFMEMRREMDELFRRFMDTPLEPMNLMPRFEEWYGDFTPARFSPSLDIADEKDHIRVVMELPGMTEKDIEVTLSSDTLHIRGEKRLEEKTEEEGYYRTERSYGSFERRIPLPLEVEPEGVEARFDKGVLTVRLKKAAGAARPRQIPVRASA